jgi:hypothetical protein
VRPGRLSIECRQKSAFGFNRGTICPGNFQVERGLECNSDPPAVLRHVEDGDAFPHHNDGRRARTMTAADLERKPRHECPRLPGRNCVESEAIYGSLQNPLGLLNDSGGTL